MLLELIKQGNNILINQREISLFFQLSSLIGNSWIRVDFEMIEILLTEKFGQIAGLNFILYGSLVLFGILLYEGLLLDLSMTNILL